MGSIGGQLRKSEMTIPYSPLEQPLSWSHQQLTFPVGQAYTSHSPACPPAKPQQQSVIQQRLQHQPLQQQHTAHPQNPHPQNSLPQNSLPQNSHPQNSQP